MVSTGAPPPGTGGTTPPAWCTTSSRAAPDLAGSQVVSAATRRAFTRPREVDQR